MTAPKSPHPPDVDPDENPRADLDDAIDVRLENADFSNRRLLRSSVRRIELHLCRLTGVELAEATWNDVVLTECRADLAGFRHAKLRRVVFRECRLEEAEFAGAALTDVVFDRCELRRASFAGCTVERVELSGCDLTELVGVESLRGARMPWDDLLQNAPLFAQGLGIQVLADE
ncbi:MAG TPA: pentapeptide repeat-containing protein [Gaiellaceae bacterium]